MESFRSWPYQTAFFPNFSQCSAAIDHVSVPTASYPILILIPPAFFFDDFAFFGPKRGTGRNQNREYRHHFATEHDTPSPRCRPRTKRGPEPSLSV